jgi:hypothetical protein
VGKRWTLRGKPGLVVEQIRLNDRDCWRVAYRRAVIAYCYSIAEVEAALNRRGLSLADFTEIDDTFDL